VKEKLTVSGKPQVL